MWAIQRPDFTTFLFFRQRKLLMEREKKEKRCIAKIRDDLLDRKSRNSIYSLMTFPTFKPVLTNDMSIV